MASPKLVSAVLGLGFLFFMHGTSWDSCFALAEDGAPIDNGIAAAVQDVHAVSARQELIVDDDHVNSRKLWLQGRKMAAHHDKRRKEKEPSGMDKSGSDSKISSSSEKSSAEASKQSLEESVDDQPVVPLWKPKQMPARGDGRELDEVLLEEPHDETERLLMAAKEIENLMQKDYRGMSKPRRKPPINNHEPRH